MGISNMMSGWGSGFGGWAMYLGVILFAVGLLALVVWLIRTLAVTPSPAQVQTSQTAAPPGRETALDTLKRRYAAGEIDAIEFRQKSADLS